MPRNLSTDLDARVAAIVERTTRDQGLSLEVVDPVGLHAIGVLVLTAQGGEAA